MKRSAAFAVLALLTAGCSAIVGRGDWDPFRSSSESRVQIFVFNEAFGRVMVHALSPGRRVSLGTIEGNQQNTFTIPWSVSQDMRFQLEVAGGRTHTTSSTLVHPGDQLQVRVRDPVTRSEVRR